MLFESVGILTKIFSDNDDEVMALLHCDGTVMALLHCDGTVMALLHCDGTVAL